MKVRFQPDKVPIFMYDRAPQTDTVVVVAGGPSMKLYSSRVKKFIKKNKSVVFAANYNFEKFGIHSDYTYITDVAKFKENIKSINSELILTNDLINNYGVRDGLIDHVERFPVYRAGCEGKKHVYEEREKLRVSKKGNILHSEIGICGLGALLLATMCRPKKILVVGLDDPKDPDCYSKKNYLGEKTIYNKRKKAIKVIRYFSTILLPYLKASGIELLTYENVGLHGVDKHSDKYDIEVIE